MKQRKMYAAYPATWMRTKNSCIRLVQASSGYFRSENGTETEIAVQKGCIELIDELGRMENQYMQLQSRLRKEVNLFTGHFDEDNTFKFKTKFNEDWEYIRFADELHDFVEENKINEFVRRINNEHSDIFKRISMDTSMLTASKVIYRI